MSLPRRVRKSHLIAVNQQLLSLGVVLVLALSALGTLTLDIVGPDGRGIQAAPRTTPAIDEGDAYVATTPVKPKVREVAVRTPATPAPSSEATPGPKAPAPAPAPRSEAGLQLATTTGVEQVSGLGTVGVTWAESDPYAEGDIRVDVRSLAKPTWSAWQKVEYHDDHGPDVGEASGERTLRAGTEPTVVGHVDGVQVRVFTRTGRIPAAMRVVLIDPGADREVKRAPAINTADLGGTKSAEKAQEKAQGAGGISLSAMKTAPKPKIYSRAQWGADERIREQGKPSYGTVKTGFVHHTVNANNYSAAQVPALLRGIYAYHVVSRGWRDIGYNFLVDRFGRIWEGRYGGVDKAVVGAHTLGYNEVSFAMSAIGNFDITKPPQAVVDAYSRLFAWKLSMYNIRADASGLRVKGKTLHAINGHRDVGQTACPGRYLYARIPDIRAAAAKIQRGAGSSTPTPPPPSSPGITTVPASGMPVSASRLPQRQSVIGDSRPDVLVRDATSHAVSTVPTTEQVRVGAAVPSGGSWSSYDAVVPVGDVNGDGKGDLLTRVTDSARSGVRLGKGDGTFSSRSTGTDVFAGYGSLTGVGDMDRDGHPDVVGTKGTKIMLFRGTTGAGFLSPVTLARGWKGGALVGVGDVSGSGSPDLGYVNGARHVVVLPGGSSLGKASVLAATVPAGATLLGGSDVTGDGRADLLVRDGAAVRVLPATGRGIFGTSQGPWNVLTGLRHLGVGPAVGSSATQLVGYDASSKLQVRAVYSRLRMGAPVPSGRSLGDAAQLLSPGDWNGDGKADLISVTSTHAVGFRYGNGKGGFGAWHTMLEKVGSGTTFSAAGDVNGDGDPDLIARGAKGGLTVYRGNGASGFRTPMRVAKTLRSYNQIGVGTWSSTASGVRLFASDKSFVPTVGTLPSWVVGSYDWVVGQGDVDGDGRADLIVRKKSNHGLYLLPGTSSGTFSARVYLGPGFGGYDLGG